MNKIDAAQEDRVGRATDAVQPIGNHADVDTEIVG
jgi:hypothetical protein